MQVKPDDVNMTDSENMIDSEQDAIDCWVHGIAHLVEGLGRSRATSLMVCATGYLIEENGHDERAKPTR